MSVLADIGRSFGTPKTMISGIDFQKSVFSDPARKSCFSIAWTLGVLARQTDSSKSDSPTLHASATLRGGAATRKTYSSKRRLKSAGETPRIQQPFNPTLRLHFAHMLKHRISSGANYMTTATQEVESTFCRPSGTMLRRFERRVNSPGRLSDAIDPVPRHPQDAKNDRPINRYVNCPMGESSIVHRPDLFAPLDAARGLAALAVVAFHLRYDEAVRQAAPILYAIARNGFLGVALFFVVSGYCLAAAAKGSLRRRSGVKQFLYRRFRRIYPPLWCSIAFVVSLPWLKYFAFYFAGRESTWPQPLYLSMGFWDWIGTATLLQGFRYGAMPLDEKFSAINVVYWSLGIEIQFYLVMALAITKRQFYYPVLITVTIIGTIAALARALGSYELNSGLFLPHWPLFAFGIILYELRSRDWTLGRFMPRRIATMVAILGTAAIVVVVVWRFQSSTSTPPIQFGLWATAFLWLLIPIQDHYEQTSKRFQLIVQRATWPMFWLGTISYSVYLIHYNLHKLVTLVLAPFMAVDSVMVQLVTPLLVCLASFPFYWLCERPFLNKSTSKSSTTAQPNHGQLVIS